MKRTLCALVVLALPGALAASAQADTLYVDPGAAGCSDTASAAVAHSSATPWCSPLPALRLARPGDVVHLKAATYRVQLRPAVSGTTSAPIVFEADGAVAIVPPPGSVGVLLAHVHDLVLRGLTVRASATQGVSADDVQHVTLDHDTVTNLAGVGVWIKHASDITISACSLVKSARAGLFDSQYATRTLLTGSTVTGNGIDGQRYDGDGVELNGSYETVRSTTITGNGDGIGFEHGIYVGSSASRYTISSNRIGANAGADIKATGGAGLISYNRLDSGLFGLVLSDNSALVQVQYNRVQGRFQHGIFLTTGTTPARARLWNNTVRQTGRLTSSGDASAVFVASASQLVLRNNLFSYTNADMLGSALFVNDAARLGGLDSRTNWFSSTDRLGRNLAWNGSRVTLAAWQGLSGQDLASRDSPPPAFDSSGAVVPPSAGARAGTDVGLTRDLVGVGVASPPDIGAYQSGAAGT